ncbi:Hypothetical predicted protein [Octopus vulgaris]|uniref:DUF4817 domain-containing protein n=1 Tax=Octopus vulgaris TaxID=6645 RepID=A0AA36AGR6_OCTVU|nr:Hypothetical predicted protein [Octopus vulgaris]
MAFMKEKSQCVLWFHETKSPIPVLRNFRKDYSRNPPGAKSVKNWYNKFKDSSSVDDRKRTGRPRYSEGIVDVVRTAYKRILRKSTRRVSRELRVSQPTIFKILHKRLKLRAYKVHIVQTLKPNDLPKRAAFAEEILNRIDTNNGYL